MLFSLFLILKNYFSVNLDSDNIIPF